MRSYNGRWFTVGFVILIVAVLAISLVVNRRFETVTERFGVLRQEWGHVAFAVETPFSRIDAVLVDVSGPAKQWRSMRQEYRRTAIYDEQSRMLDQMWGSYKAWRQDNSSVDPVATQTESPGIQQVAVDPEQRVRIERFIEADRDIERLLADPLGRLTYRMLLLDYPPRVYPTLREIFGNPSSIAPIASGKDTLESTE